MIVGEQQLNKKKIYMHVCIGSRRMLNNIKRSFCCSGQIALFRQTATMKSRRNTLCLLIIFLVFIVKTRVDFMKNNKNEYKMKKKPTATVLWNNKRYMVLSRNFNIFSLLSILLLLLFEQFFFLVLFGRKSIEFNSIWSFFFYFKNGQITNWCIKIKNI